MKIVYKAIGESTGNYYINIEYNGSIYYVNAANWQRGGWTYSVKEKNCEFELGGSICNAIIEFVKNYITLEKLSQ